MKEEVKVSKEVAKRRNIINYIAVAMGSIIVAFNIIFLRDQKTLFAVLNVIGASVALGPPLYIRYVHFRTLKKIESTFPYFLNDIVDSAKAGQTLPQAIKTASRNQYGPLSPYVEKMAVQVDWGIPFDKILRGFADDLNSKLLKRTVATIIQTYRSGGNIPDVLSAVSKSVVEIDKIREERKAHVYSQMVTGYTIYFVFLGVIVGLQKFLIPTLLFSGAGVDAGEGLTENYAFMFQNLILIQGFFSGLAIGKMSEGSLVAGFKHVVVLVGIGFTVVVALI